MVVMHEEVVFARDVVVKRSGRRTRDQDIAVPGAGDFRHGKTVGSAATPPCRNVPEHFLNTC